MYISPENFELPQAIVQDGIFGPQGPAFKAMVLSQQNISLVATKQLEKYAMAGLRIVIVNDTLDYYPTRNSGDKSAVQNALEKLIRTENVHVSERGRVAQTLQSLGIYPRVGVNVDNSTWHVTWREDEESGTDYVYVFCDGPTASGELTVKTNKRPYIFNAWTGGRSAIANYHSVDGKTVVPLSLNMHQTAIIAFASTPVDGIPFLPLHVISMPRSIIGSSYTESGSLILHAARSESPTENAVLSSGNRVFLNNSGVPEGIELTNWILSAEHWKPGNLEGGSMENSKSNTTHLLKTPISWTDIPELANASGIGYYTTNFKWPLEANNSKSLGAYIQLPEVLHSASLSVNGFATPALDLANPKMDISTFLIHGDNEILIVVPTTMWNYVKSILSSLQNGGLAALPAALHIDLPVTRNGLIGPVVLIPYLPVLVSI
jgi:hypothetical protein